MISDIHGNYDALARAADGADRLIILGDLLDYVDYHDPTAGIMGHMFGEENARHFARLRAAGDFPSLRQFNARLWSGVPDAAAVLSGLVEERYRTVLGRIGTDSLVILGNVDVASEWERVAGSVIPARDAEVVEIGGLRFGFVAGGARRAGVVPPALGSAAPAWRPYVRPADDYRASVQALGDVDVLCSHLPPDIPGLRYDVVPARVEMAGPGLLTHIDRHQPALSLFGHVHQPLAHRARRGRTECINVGHFQRTERALTLDLDGIVAATGADR